MCSVVPVMCEVPHGVVSCNLSNISLLLLQSYTDLLRFERKKRGYTDDAVVLFWALNPWLGRWTVEILRVYACYISTPTLHCELAIVIHHNI